MVAVHPSLTPLLTSTRVLAFRGCSEIGFGFMGFYELERLGLRGIDILMGCNVMIRLSTVVLRGYLQQCVSQEGFAFAHCTTCKAPYHLRVHVIADRKWLFSLWFPAILASSCMVYLNVWASFTFVWNTKKHLTQRVQNLDDKFLEQKEISKSILENEQLLVEQLEQSRVHLALWYKLHNDLSSTLEQRAILENEMLRRQVEELRCLFPQTDRQVPSYLEYYPVEKEKSLVNHGVTSPDLVSNFAFENGDSDITLHLGGELIWLPQEGFYFLLLQLLPFHRTLQGSLAIGCQVMFMARGRLQKEKLTPMTQGAN
ncbi:unnamed protein product [Prunus armeniaca]|uniref:Uncharacterized protein n=1 Tax=Prunus armeniaca TaxID=36596 RepID=A0A6J5TH14_PRUAR|nr:unnamed protein product [Prunus armeniaca]